MLEVVENELERMVVVRNRRFCVYWVKNGQGRLRMAVWDENECCGMEMRANARKRPLSVENACFCSKTVADSCYFMKIRAGG